jgi:hypothetical protein
MFISNIINLILASTWMALIFEAITTPRILLENYGIDIRVVSLGILLILVVFSKTYSKARPTNSLLFFNKYYLFPISVILASIMILAEYFTRHNFVVNLTGLHYGRIFYLGLSSGLVALFFSTPESLQIHARKIVFMLPAIILTVFAFIYLRNFQYFYNILQEDHLVENAQFLLMLGGSILAFLLAKNFWNLYQKNKQAVNSKAIASNNVNFRLGLLYLFMGIAMFFVAGEEISWGQRIIGLDTPEPLTEINIQDEITIHNIGIIFGYVYRGYIFLGLFGAFAWILVKALNKISFTKQFLNKLLSYIPHVVPKWYLMLFYLLPAIFFYYKINIDWTTKEWGEFFEFILYVGVFLMVLENYLLLNYKSFIAKIFSNH